MAMEYSEVIILGKRSLGNISLQSEKNYSIKSENVDIWGGEFPYKAGDKFPSEKLQERADISLTNRMLFNNEYDKIFGYMLNSINELDPIYGMQIKEIASNLPYFKTITEAYVSLCCSPLPIIDTPDVVDTKVSNVVHNSNLYPVIQSVFKSLMVDTIDAYKLSVDIKGNPIFTQIPVKNLEVFVSSEDLVTIYCVNVSNVLNDKVEFISYYFDGRIEKRTFNYSGGILGSLIGEVEQSEAFGGKYKESPIIVVKHNTESINDVYGVDQFRYWDAGVVGLCRSLANLFKLNERCREIIRKLPEGAISRVQTGASLFLNKGVVTYPDGTSADQRPDIEYLIPELKNNIDACISTIEKTTKLLSVSSSLSPVWFDFEKMGSNLSAKSLRAAMIPTTLKAQMMCDNMTPYIKEMVQKLALLSDIEINFNDIDIYWEAGVGDDESDVLDIVERRLSNNTMTIEDAIARLDRVPRRIARERSNKLQGLNVNTNVDSDDVNVELGNNELGFDTSDRNINTSRPMRNTDNMDMDNEIIPDIMLPIIPTN